LSVDRVVEIDGHGCFPGPSFPTGNGYPHRHFQVPSDRNS
jgi:hypothetical protein